MRRVILSEKAADEVMRIRENRYDVFNEEKCAIADSYAELTGMINIGRDCEEIASCTEGILMVMSVLERYNGLLNRLAETDDKNFGEFKFVNPEQDYDKDKDSSVWGIELELLKRVFDKQNKKIYAPANVDAITISEAASALGLTVDELKIEMDKERREKYEQEKTLIV